jgi:soluble lytic murein transglycosylase-like protein
MKAHPNFQRIIALLTTITSSIAVAFTEPSSNVIPLPETASIENFPFATDAQLLASLGISSANGFQDVIIETEKWIRRSTSNSFKKICQNIASESKNIFEPISLEHIKCLPYFIENAAKPVIEPAEFSSGSSVRSQAQWLTLAERGFSESFHRINVKNLDDLKKYMGFFRETSHSCAFRNAGAGLFSSAESLLPDESVAAVIEEVYQKIAPCLKIDEEAYERTHLRAGLLRLSRNDEPGAKTALLASLKSENPKEKYRSLFWLGVIERRNSQSNEKNRIENSYWNLLTANFPLEIHSIVAAKTMGLDPMNNWIDNAAMNARRRSGKGWTAFSATALITEILLNDNDSGRLKNWFQFVLKSVQTREADELLYLGIAASRANQHLAAIIFLTRYLKERPNGKVNLAFTSAYFPQPFADIVLENSGKTDPVLVFALIRQESAFNPNARSGANARGLMQLLPSTAQRFERISQQDLYDTETNIRIGVKYLEALMKQYQGRADLVLAGYNAGPSNIRRWQNRYPTEQDLLFADLIPFKETRGYVSSIFRNAYWYGRLLTLQRNRVAQVTIEKSMQSEWRSHVVHNLLEIAWNSSKETATHLREISKIYSPTPEPNSINKKTNKGSVIQEFPAL